MEGDEGECRSVLDHSFTSSALEEASSRSRTVDEVEVEGGGGGGEGGEGRGGRRGRTGLGAEGGVQAAVGGGIIGVTRECVIADRSKDAVVVHPGFPPAPGRPALI